MLDSLVTNVRFCGRLRLANDTVLQSNRVKVRDRTEEDLTSVGEELRGFGRQKVSRLTFARFYPPSFSCFGYVSQSIVEVRPVALRANLVNG